MRIKHIQGSFTPPSKEKINFIKISNIGAFFDLNIVVKKSQLLECAITLFKLENPHFEDEQYLEIINNRSRANILAPLSARLNNVIDDCIFIDVDNLDYVVNFGCLFLSKKSLEILHKQENATKEARIGFMLSIEEKEALANPLRWEKHADECWEKGTLSIAHMKKYLRAYQ